MIWTRADFVYMAPPFIAYYGALQGGNDGTDLLRLAHSQCKLYRQYLTDGSGLWRHIVLGDWQDNNHWGTGARRSDIRTSWLHLSLTLPLIGNAWAAAGMLRVLETIRRSHAANDLLPERLEITAWINEILNATWSHQVCMFPALSATTAQGAYSEHSTPTARCSITSTKTRARPS